MQELKNKPITCITTGAPRVVDLNFAKHYNKLMENTATPFKSYRVVNNCDIVPSVPFYNWGFAHVGDPIWLCKKFKNWAVVYLTMVDRLDSTTKEAISRPYGYSGSVSICKLQTTHHSCKTNFCMLLSGDPFSEFPPENMLLYSCLLFLFHGSLSVFRNGCEFNKSHGVLFICVNSYLLGLFVHSFMKRLSS